MDSKSGTYPNSFVLFMLLALAINYSYGIPSKYTTVNSVIENSTTNIKANPLSHTPTVHKSNAEDNGESIIRRLSDRTKREIGKSNSNAFSSFGFPTNVDNEAIHKWLVLLTAKPKNTFVAVDDYDEDDDPPAIELVHGKKPGSTKPLGGKGKSSRDTKNGSAWVVDEPIVLYQHRMSKRSFPAIPDVLLRDLAAGSRTQPDPAAMRNFLIHMASRRQQRPENDVANDGYYYASGQPLSQ